MPKAASLLLALRVLSLISGCCCISVHYDTIRGNIRVTDSQKNVCFTESVAGNVLHKLDCSGTNEANMTIEVMLHISLPNLTNVGRFQETVFLNLPSPLSLRSAAVWRGNLNSIASNSSEVFGAAEITTDLLQQEYLTCSRSWDSIRRSGFWKKIEDAGDRTPIAASFLLIHYSDDTESLQRWQHIYPGHHAQYRLSLSVPRQPFVGRMSITRRENQPGEDSTLSVSASSITCRNAAVNCSFRSPSGDMFDSKLSVSRWISSIQKHEVFDLVTAKNSPGSIGSLTCCLDGSNQCQFLTFNMNYKFSISPVWVAGRSVTVTIIIFNFYWTFKKKTCEIGGVGIYALESVCMNSSTSETAQQQRQCISSTRIDDSQEIFSLKVPVTTELLKKSIECRIVQEASPIAEFNHHYYISAISEPCVTDVDLGTGLGHWREGEVRQIRVTSRDCSVWSASHSCWLTDSLSIVTEQLMKIQQSNFSSIHQLIVRRWMGQRDWLVRCSVNQSGVLYDDVENRVRNRPDVFYQCDSSLFTFTRNDSSMSFTIVTLNGRPATSSLTCDVPMFNGSVIQARLHHTQMTPGGHLWTFTCPGASTVAAFIVCMTRQYNGNEMVFQKQHLFSVSLDSTADKTQPTLLHTASTYVAFALFSIIAALGFAVAVAAIVIAKRRTILTTARAHHHQPAVRTAAVQLPQRPVQRYTEDTGAYAEAETVMQLESVRHQNYENALSTAASYAVRRLQPRIPPRYLEADATHSAAESVDLQLLHRENSRPQTPVPTYIN